MNRDAERLNEVLKRHEGALTYAFRRPHASAFGEVTFTTWPCARPPRHRMEGTPLDENVDDSALVAVETDRERISDGLFADLAKARNVVPLICRLEAVGVDVDRVEELAGLVRCAGSLIYQRPDVAGQALRDAFLDALVAAVRRIAPDVGIAQLERAIRTVRIAERGHHIILETLGRAEISKEPPAVRAAAAIARVEANLARLREDLSEAMRRGVVIIPGGVMVDDGRGGTLSADIQVTALVESLGGTLMMEAYAYGWLGKGGRIELPSLPPVGDREIFMTGASEYLAMSWLRWERFHQTARYLNEDIDELTGDVRPKGLPDEITTVFTRPGKMNLPDWIANERALDRDGIATWDLMVTTNVTNRAGGIRDSLRLPSDGWISPQEVTNCLSLSEVVGYNIVSDTDRHGGLRLVQWVRGYIALSTWAAERLAAGHVGIVRTTRAELIDLLTRLSFTEMEAATFLDAASFGRASRDLFDAPIVRTAGEWLLIGPATASPRLARIVPSLLASMNIQLKRKGRAFEDRVLAFLKEQNLDARRVHVWRDGAEYEFDALVCWGGRLFLFECKNHGLSGNDPMQAHHFLQEIESSVHQVRRLVEALERWPDILTDEFGAGFSYDEIVPCILENETYSLSVQFGGVYVYDWSALTRFFSEGSFGVSRDHRLPENTVARNRVPVKRIWAGGAPTADDLIAQMRDPHQFAVVAHHRLTERFWFQLSTDTAVSDVGSRRTPMTTESIAAFCGASPDAVIAQLDEGDAEIDRVKARYQAEDGVDKA
jgi:hypothetical protein